MGSTEFGTPSEPNPLARLLSHLAVGGATWLLVKQVASNATASVLSALMTIAHYLFDLPVARWLGGLNFN
jgi:hypothetical protein